MKNKKQQTKPQKEKKKQPKQTLYTSNYFNINV